MQKLEPVTLTGRLVHLEPLRREHTAALYEVCQDPSIWAYLLSRQPQNLAEMEQKVAAALAEQDRGTTLPFVIIDRPQERIVGETRYLNIVLPDRGLEIGSTWLTPAVQRTGINTECKYLLLSYAFETLQAIRVQLKTHHNNLKSQRAIERLGAVKEGILRNHMIMPDGSYRNSVYYSIIENEWPQVKIGLEAKMRREG